GPFAEERLRRALQLSNGDLGGLFDPLAVIVYVIVALILLFPLLRWLLPRKAVVPVLTEAVHEIEEAHHHSGSTTAVPVERRPDDEARRTSDRAKETDSGGL
ncbi:MAG: protein of unknown function transrane, partial [Frankiales bacterium]|nr:protein of unknown function transrane [Frankiales bacterium]